MAASINSISGPAGIYNQFLMRITTDETAQFKTSYRVEVTAGDSDPVTFTYDVQVNNQTDKRAWTNPLIPLRERYFKSLIFQDISPVNPYGYADVRIRVGELYATAADLPATFRGYDVDQTIQCYNGYDPEAIRILRNYVNPNWQTVTPIKLPIVKKTWYLGDVENQDLSAFSYLLWNGADDYDLKNVVFQSFTVDGIPVDTTTIDVSSFYTEHCIYGESLKAVIWDTPGNYFQNNVVDYVEVKFQYETPLAALVDTELLTVRRGNCNPKYDRFVLSYTNRYGASEYQEFILRSNRRQTVNRGKTVLSDGINYNASSSSEALGFNELQRYEFGKVADQFIELNSGYLTQEEIDALKDLYKSPRVYMIDKDNVTIPVMLQGGNFDIINTSNELAQVRVNLKYSDLDKIQIQ